YIPAVDARLLPLFPLPVVLFPGTARPLHIFEARYRRMLADCLDGDRRFGLLFCADTEHERALPPGQIGCIARIETADLLPDGRSNIIVAGEDRFALARFVDTDTPYLVGEVVDYADEPELDAELDPLAESVRAAFERLVRAVRAIADQRTPVPELPRDTSCSARDPRWRASAPSRKSSNRPFRRSSGARPNTNAPGLTEAGTTPR